MIKEFTRSPDPLRHRALWPTMLQTMTGELPAPSCPAAFDVNRDTTFDFADAIHLLTNLYLNGPAPPTPYPVCDAGTFEDEMECATLLCP